MRIVNSSSSLRSVPRVTRSRSQHSTSRGIEVTESLVEAKSYSSKLTTAASSSSTAKSNLSPKNNKAAGATIFNKSASHDLQTKRNGRSKSPKKYLLNADHPERAKNSQVLKAPAARKKSRSRSPQKRGTPTNVPVRRDKSPKSLMSTEAIVGTLPGLPKKQGDSRSKSPMKWVASRSKSPKKRDASRSNSPANRSASNQPRKAPAASKIKTGRGISLSPSKGDQSNGNLRISRSESARSRMLEKVAEAVAGPSETAQVESRGPTTIELRQTVYSSEMRDQHPLRGNDTLERDQIPTLHCEEEGVEIVAVMRKNIRRFSLIEGDAAETEVIAPAELATPTELRRKGRRLPFFLKTKTPDSDRKVDSREAGKKKEAVASNNFFKSISRRQIVKEKMGEKPVKAVTSKLKRASEKPPKSPMSPMAGTRIGTALAAVPTSRIRSEQRRPEDVPACKISQPDDLQHSTSKTASKDSFDTPHSKVSQPGDLQHPATKIFSKESLEESQGRELAWKKHDVVEQSVGAILPRTTSSMSMKDSTAVDNDGSQSHHQAVQRDVKVEAKAILKDDIDGHDSAIERKKFSMSPSSWLFPSSEDPSSDGHTSLGSFFLTPGRRLKEHGRSMALPSVTKTDSIKSESKHGDRTKVGPVKAEKFPYITKTEKLTATLSSDAEPKSEVVSLPVVSAPRKSGYNGTRSVSPSVSSTDDHEAFSATSLFSTDDQESVSETSSSLDGGSAASNGRTVSTGGSYDTGDGSTTVGTSINHGSSAESENCFTMGESMSQSVGQESDFSYRADEASVTSSLKLQNSYLLSQDFPSSDSRDSFQGSSEWDIISVLGQRSLYDEHGTIDSSVLQEFLDAADHGSVSTYGGNQSVSDESLLQVDQAIETFRLHAQRLGVSEQDLLKAMYGARPDIAKQYYAGSSSRS